MKTVRALVLTGYGLNCDYETDFSLQLAGANSERVHINELIPSEKSDARVTLNNYHILVVGGGFSWADDHGAGVIMASKLRYNIGEQIEEFIGEGIMTREILLTGGSHSGLKRRAYVFLPRGFPPLSSLYGMAKGSFTQRKRLLID
jgi:hypothetical protein